MFFYKLRQFYQTRDCANDIMICTLYTSQGSLDLVVHATTRQLQLLLITETHIESQSSLYVAKCLWEWFPHTSHHSVSPLYVWWAAPAGTVCPFLICLYRSTNYDVNSKQKQSPGTYGNPWLIKDHRQCLYYSLYGLQSNVTIIIIVRLIKFVCFWSWLVQ